MTNASEFPTYYLDLVDVNALKNYTLCAQSHYNFFFQISRERSWMQPFSVKSCLLSCSLLLELVSRPIFILMGTWLWHNQHPKLQSVTSPAFEYLLYVCMLTTLGIILVGYWSDLFITTNFGYPLLVY